MATISPRRPVFRLPVAGSLTLLLVVAVAGSATACPFCSATSQTLSEEIQAADVAVLARAIRVPAADPLQAAAPADPDAGKATFGIVEVLRGKQHLVGVEEIEVVYFGRRGGEQLFLITGIGTDRTDWMSPLPLSEAAAKYVRQIMLLPEKGADRLAFYQDYLQSEDALLATDAYDEFARAPYDEVIALKDRMKHDELLEWISDVEVSATRRRLYLTMLGVCGTKDDVALLEYFLTPSGDAHRMAVQSLCAASLLVHPAACGPPLASVMENYEKQKKRGLDALIASYLILKGEEGLPLIEDLFLRNPDGDYAETYAAIMALRWHGEEGNVLSRGRLLEAVHLVLDIPTFADQVVLDLSRWDDWSVLDRLVKMFKDSPADDYARRPIAQYLLVASGEEGEVGRRAVEAIGELEKMDPETVEQARNLMAFSTFAAPKPTRRQDAAGDAPSADEAELNADNTTNQEPAEQDSLTRGETAPPQDGNPEVDEVAADVDDPAAVDTAVAQEETANGAAVAGGEATTSAVGESDTLAAAGTGGPSDPAETDSSSELSDEAAAWPPPPRMWLVAIPLAAGLVLMACFWLILRGSAGRS